ncbi:MAG: TRAP transporter substrate-binding protein DctP [Rubrobacteraceae bacterium]
MSSFPASVTVKRCLVIVAVLALVLGVAVGCGGGGGGASGEVTLRLTHQWPKATPEKGDFRAVIAERFKEEVEKQTDGQVKIEISPNASLVEPTEQYDSITQQATDMSVFPMDYAAGNVPAFSITLMPAMVRNHAQAQNYQDAEIGGEIEKLAEDNDVKILTWIWNAGAVGVRKGDPITSPDDVKKGNTTRAAGVRVEEMLESIGFGISSMPSSEIYNGMQTGTLDSAITSASSFSSYRLYEQVDSYTSPTENTFWFMFEPLIIGTQQFEELTPEQQDIVEKAGQDLQEYAYTASEEDDQRVEEEFEKNDVEVVTINDADFEKWQEVSEPVWDSFAKDVDGGQRMIDLAKEVPAE